MHSGRHCFGAPLFTDTRLLLHAESPADDMRARADHCHFDGWHKRLWRVVTWLRKRDQFETISVTCEANDCVNANCITIAVG
jgi:hypothetical protein